MLAPLPPDGIFALPCCSLGACITPAGQLVQLLFLPPGTDSRSPQTAAGRQFSAALSRWLRDPASGWPDLPVLLRGTPFQQRVWSSIRSIPQGQSRTYSALAAELGTIPRAVGQACGANPLPLLVPCHRVVSSAGCGGFGHARDGWLIETKRWLLAREGVRA